MYLSELKLWNFRKYGTKDNNSITDSNPGLEVIFSQGVNVLIGENDSGKSTIVDAIKYVLLTQSKDFFYLDEKDFHKSNDEKTRRNKLKIECVFRGFSNKEAGNFLEWIGFNKENEYELKIWLTAEFKNNRVIVNTRAGADNEGTLIDGEARDLLRVTYLKPLRDAEAELSPGRKSRLAQILRSHKLFDKDHPEYKSYKKDKEENEIHRLEEIIKDANEEIIKYFTKETYTISESKDSNPKELNTVAGAKVITTNLIDYLTEFFPIGEIEKDGDENQKKSPKFKIAEGNLLSILHKLSLVLEEDKSGLGSLNLLFIAAELLLLQYDREDSLRLLLIEEIEAHLHPQAQLRLIEYFNDKKKQQQTILTTHSITLGSQIPLDNLIICKGDKIFPMGTNFTQLQKGDYHFLQRFLDATKANLFFARGVIIVEGDAENLLIPTIAEIIGMPLHKYGVSIVNVGSTAFKRYAKIFLRNEKDDEKLKEEWLNIPVAIITDKDEQKPEKVNEIKTEWNKQNVRIFVTLSQTLEYELATSELKEDFIKAALIAKKIHNSKEENYYQKIVDEKDEFIIPAEINQDNENWKDKTADEIYKHFFKDYTGLKTITAEIFSEILKMNKERVKIAFNNDDVNNPLKYLKDAIIYTTTGNIETNERN
jgi:putative ATP-dependent endonuclease of OLD family